MKEKSNLMNIIALVNRGGKDSRGRTERVACRVQFALTGKVSLRIMHWVYFSRWKGTHDPHRAWVTYAVRKEIKGDHVIILMFSNLEAFNQFQEDEPELVGHIYRVEVTERPYLEEVLRKYLSLRVR